MLLRGAKLPMMPAVDEAVPEYATQTRKSKFSAWFGCVARTSQTAVPLPFATWSGAAAIPSKVVVDWTGENGPSALDTRRATGAGGEVLPVGTPLTKVTGMVLTHRLTPAGTLEKTAWIRVPKSARPAVVKLPGGPDRAGL